MVETRELSNDLRQEIIARLQNGKGYRIIASELNLGVSTVVRKWKTTGTVTKNLHRSGRPSKLNDVNAQCITVRVKKDQFATRSEIQKDLPEADIKVIKDTIKNNKSIKRTGPHSRSARKTPLLKHRHVRDHLYFVKNMKVKGKTSKAK